VLSIRQTIHDPFDCYHASRGIRRVLDALRDDRFSPDEPGLFQPIIDSLLYGGDPYFHLADFDSYVAAQQRVSSGFQNIPEWACKAILNVARSGKFTSDRAVSEYAKDIWGIRSMTG
jgi:starch phosphorylase